MRALFLELVFFTLMVAFVAAEAPEGEVLSAAPPLPRNGVLAATLVRNDKWYALDSRQITALRKVTAGEPYTAPRKLVVTLPPCPNRIVLWAAGDHGLVPEDVIQCNDLMKMIYSTKKGRVYSLSDSPEHTVLVGLMDRIRASTEQPVMAPVRATNGASSGAEKTAGTPKDPSAGSSVDKNRPHPSAAEARKALILMIEQDHKNDRLLQGALPYLRTKEIKQVEDGVVEIGAWTCYLKERRFVGEYISMEQNRFARFTGDFRLVKPGDWKAVIVEQTRND